MLDQQARSYKQEYGEYDEYANFKSYIYTNHEILIYEGFYFSARNWIKKNVLFVFFVFFPHWYWIKSEYANFFQRIHRILFSGQTRPEEYDEYDSHFAAYSSGQLSARMNLCRLHKK